MNLGFYYHVSLNSSPSGLKIPAYLGVFLDSLASEVETLTLFMHEANIAETNQCDYFLKRNIKFVSLGPKTPAWDRFLWPRKTLRKIKGIVSDCDYILVRAPSPLAPRFYSDFKNKTKIAYLVVGDYAEGIKHLEQVWWRKLPIVLLNKLNDRQLTRNVQYCVTIVNSRELYRKYKLTSSMLYEVRTTTLRPNDFHYRSDTCQGVEISLLYAGRLSFAKGLNELMAAFSIICLRYGNATLHFVGWDHEASKPVENHLRRQAVNLGVLDKVFFHGYKPVGSELNEMYRMADIYVIPSYHEGFPRTIWEAMANSLPVIATTVGSIPDFLKDREDALLIEPKNKEEIVTAVQEIIENTDLRKKLISNGFELAKENTLEVQAKRIVSIICK